MLLQFFYRWFNFIYYGALINVLLSCFGNKNNTEEVPIYLQKPTQYYYTYDTTKTELINFFSGYVDTFSIAGTSFKIFCDPNPTGELEIMVFKNGQWVHNVTSYYGVDGYDRKNDVNNDGFPDFQFYSQINSHIYLYNDSTKSFDDFAGEISLLYGLADSTKSIYYQEWLNTTHAYQSDLLQYKERKPYYLFTFYALPTASEDQPYTNIRLYKCNNGKINDTVFIREQKIDQQLSTFNAKNFWYDLYND
jgi:hypothetical protein